MTPEMSAAVAALQSDNGDRVTDAARGLGLLLERRRFRQRGSGTLGEVDDLLGDLAPTDPDDDSAAIILDALRAHLADRGRHANPTVAWALGKALDTAAVGQLLETAEAVAEDPSAIPLLQQSLAALAAISPGEYPDLFLKVARASSGEAEEFARQQVEFRRWS